MTPSMYQMIAVAEMTGAAQGQRSRGSLGDGDFGRDVFRIGLKAEQRLDAGGVELKVISF